MPEISKWCNSLNWLTRERSTQCINTSILERVYLFSWFSSLIAQMVKNPPAMQETWVRVLSWEDLLEEGMDRHSSILAWRISMDTGAWWATGHGVANSWT